MTADLEILAETDVVIVGAGISPPWRNGLMAQDHVEAQRVFSCHI